MTTDKRIARLFRRTASLTNTNLLLNEALLARQRSSGVAARKAALATLRLCESHLLQGHLLNLTRRLLSMGDEEHRRIGGRLQDEILQTLVGISIRLLSLKREVNVSSADLEKYIVGTRRMMRQSWSGLGRSTPAVAGTHGH